LRVIGEESKRNETNKLTPRQLDQGISSEKQETGMLPLRLVIDSKIVVSAALKPMGSSARRCCSPSRNLLVCM
jgi:hypothetical protein